MIGPDGDRAASNSGFRDDIKTSPITLESFAWVLFLPAARPLWLQVHALWKGVMKRTLIVLSLGAALVRFSLPAQAAGSAPVRLANESVRMYPGDCSCGFGLVWTISFSSGYTEDPAQA